MTESPQEKAVELFLGNFACSQAILAAFAKQAKIYREMAFRLGSPFAAGISRRGDTCGALSGAVMILGLVYGQGEYEPKEKRYDVYRRVNLLMERFSRKHGSCICRELLGVDLSTEEGLDRAKKQELFTKRCPGYVRTAAELLDDML